VTEQQSVAIFGDVIARNLSDTTRSPAQITSGWWAVVQTFEGEFYGFRFDDVTVGASNFLSDHSDETTVASESWTSSLSQTDYEQGVDIIRDYIADGWVYQTNYCRVLSAQLDSLFDSCGLLKRIRQLNPAPYASALSINKIESGLAFDMNVASASPELFLRRTGDFIQSSPIKGTAVSAHHMLDKDEAENVMIVDLIRNDISHVCEPGTVNVPDLLRVEEHPGLTHLVSDVTGKLRPDVSWTQILEAMMPPGSVSGAPKSSALQVITELEPVEREIYCGVVGWIDADNNEAELAVAIRTFWQSLDDQHQIKFGTGAGITYASDPRGEWQETELKAQHLLSVADKNAH